MKPRITTVAEKKLIGKSMVLSLTQNKTATLWSSFMPRRKEINNTIGTALYSLQVYDSTYFQNFDPAKEYTRWAAVEVRAITSIPEGMEAFLLPGGLYAVFTHKGSSTDTSTFEYIFTQWLPASQFALDNRPHFEVLGDRYKNGAADSEEEIWIPIKPKQS